MGCEIRPILNGKIFKAKIKAGGIHYTPNELEKRGFKHNDYKRLFNKLNSGKIESSLRKHYTAKDLD